MIGFVLLNDMNRAISKFLFYVHNIANIFHIIYAIIINLLRILFKVLIDHIWELAVLANKSSLNNHINKQGLLLLYSITMTNLGVSSTLGISMGNKILPISKVPVRFQ